MNKILALLPENTVGELVVNGFAYGFEQLQCHVLIRKIRDLTQEDIEKFKPDMIFGHNYSFLENEKCAKIIKNCSCKNLVFYFADNPESVDTKKKYFFKKLDEIKSTVFIWDKTYEKMFKKCFYLPLAVNVKKYLTDFEGYKYPISLVCLFLSEERINTLCEIIKTFGNKLNVFCPEQIFNESVEFIRQKGLLQDNDLEIYKKTWRGFIEKEDDLAKIYNSTKVNLNLNFENATSINYAVFAILASGGFLISNESDEIKKYFNQKHLDFFKNSTDLVDKIAFYLDNLNVAQKMAQLGKFETMEKHNFSARARYILKKTLR